MGRDRQRRHCALFARLSRSGSASLSYDYGRQEESIDAKMKIYGDGTGRGYRQLNSQGSKAEPTSPPLDVTVDDDGEITVERPTVPKEGEGDLPTEGTNPPDD